ncbi:hypothetical protein K1T71_009590 [Dendrolimus kikuchii]|uniref:Uncharacterized protein n=1 Tax=Dendrolimus kikuchii TaxID=765133 RepID=A0ACC1CSA3_9NEOP|nr:hypothetical protein K1T71_009590 [Dendrolimus kikuchii]
MTFSPYVLLSNVARERCLNNMKEIPLFVKDSTQKANASVLVPLCIDSNELCLLYTLRSLKLKNHSGQMAFPGGKMDENETVYETALRETEEEIGFPRNDVDIWGKMQKVQGRNKDVVIMPVVGYLKNFSMERLCANEDEVADIFTVPIRTLCDPKNHAHLLFEEITAPVYLGCKHRIWGITGIITHLFLEAFLPKSLYNVNFLQKRFGFDELMPSKL